MQEGGFRSVAVTCSFQCPGERECALGSQGSGWHAAGLNGVSAVRVRGYMAALDCGRRCEYWKAS